MTHIRTIDLGARSHPILLGANMTSTLGEVLRSHKILARIAIVTDKNIAHVHLAQLTKTLRQNNFDVTEIIVPSGERQKSLDRATALYANLHRSGFTRNDALLAFGGGVIGDITGFVAATYRRGMRYIQMPTTLLAQVESALGGKTGVNFGEGKNLIGAFHQPTLIFSDVDYLSTLPQREIISGLGEVLKYAYLSKNMFSFLDKHLERLLERDPVLLQETILRCNELKAKMIEEDERETLPSGGRMVLNLGHTIGHALESLSKYTLRHGEAVLLGLRWELEIAKEAKILDPKSGEKLGQLLARVHFQPRLPFLKMTELMRKIFGKNTQAKFILPKSIGVVAAKHIDASRARNVLHKIQAGS